MPSPFNDPGSGIVPDAISLPALFRVNDISQIGMEWLYGLRISRSL
uniref:Late embryogenesis abundant protein Lea14-A n=1 Tax=Carex duriuscula subsp. rigescens TaxID=1940840 RepID=A0A291NVZ7_9POAL|nr:late embryogenesis abundant protein Lea14-A [Carex duriuscula subsp. rigescens]